MKTGFIIATLLMLAPLGEASEVTVQFDPENSEAWAENYGEREIERLSRAVQTDFERALNRAESAPTRVEVTILDAKPNRPTYDQLARRPGLDAMRSFSVGGMSLSAVAYDDAGATVLSESYDWYQNDIRHAQYRPVWGDAKLAADRFARRFVAALELD